MLSLDIAILSERGGRTLNEDACGHWCSDSHFVCVLADGAGGHGGGDIASRLAVKSALVEFATEPAANGDELRALIQDTNRAILAERRAGSRQQDMHTTVVCLVVDLERHLAYWAHAGDSRLYWFRDGQIVERTRDHSVVQGLVDAGLLSPEGLRTHPQRSELRSALGVQDGELEVSAPISTVDVAPGDRFLLCSDGLWEYVDDKALETALAGSRSPRTWVEGLRKLVEDATRSKPSHDNFSALAVWLDTAAAP